MKQALAALLAAAIGLWPGPGPAVTPGGGVASAQIVVVPSFPASAIIRGENIRLRAEPADRAADLAVLQRGDEITITGDAETADGMVFYPVEVVVTGDAGWVRELFINPKSIVPILDTAPEPAPEAEAEPEPEPAVEEPAEDDRASRRERRERRNAEAEAAEEPPADEAPVDEAPADDATADEPAAESESGAELPADDEPRAPADEGDEPAAEEPTDEPAADEPAETPAASVAGEDVMATEPFALEPGRYRVTATLEASEATGFVVNLLGPRDFNEPLFEDQVDSAQSWTVRTSVTVERQGDYVVEVAEAAGAWVLEFVPR